MSLNAEQLELPEFDLEPLCNPKSVAIIGCSNDLTRLSGRPLKSLFNYKYTGKIYPVNPKYENIHGLTSYPNMQAIPEPVDVALILVPAIQVESVLKDCIAAKTKAVIIFSSGFAELGKEGQEAQKRIQRLAEQARIPVLGPNCLGVINLADSTPLSFSSVLDYEGLPVGGLALVSQSGAIGTYILGVSGETRMGFSYWITTGNEAILEISTIVKYLLKNEKVSGVLLYLEEARNAKGLIEAGKVAEEVGKPLICLKVGRSNSGRRAALSHTGAMAGVDKEYDAVFQKSGIVRAEHIEEMLDLGVVHSEAWKPAGKRVGVITLSGGGGIIAADECEKLGLEVPELSPALQKELAKVVPSFGSTKNPVDVTAEMVASPGLLRKSIEIMLECDEIDSLMLFLGLQKKNAVSLATDIAEMAEISRRKKGKPVVVGWMAPPKEAVEILRKAKVPLLFDGVRTINALAKLVNKHSAAQSSGAYQSVLTDKESQKPLTKDDLRSLLFSAVSMEDSVKDRFALTEYAGKKFLQKIGLSIPGAGVAGSVEEAVALAEKIGYPVVAKIDSPDILHKSDAGAVKVGLKNPDELRKAYEEIMYNSQKFNAQARLNGVLVEEMVEDALQTIVGLKFSEKFGPLVVFGVGGIFVEILKDFSIRLAPVNEEEAFSMISELKAYKMFTGARGAAPRDIKALAKAISTVSYIGAELGDSLLELDINPLFVLKEGAGVKVGDALIALKGGCK